MSKHTNSAHLSYRHHYRISCWPSHDFIFVYYFYFDSSYFDSFSFFACALCSLVYIQIMRFLCHVSSRGFYLWYAFTIYCLQSAQPIISYMGYDETIEIIEILCFRIFFSFCVQILFSAVAAATMTSNSVVACHNWRRRCRKMWMWLCVHMIENWRTRHRCISHNGIPIFERTMRHEWKTDDLFSLVTADHSINNK